MNKETLKNQYLAYIDTKLSTVLSLGGWHEHTTGATLDSDTHDAVVADVMAEIGETLPKVIEGANG